MAVYEGNENFIFISYAHKDSPIVLPIIERLQENGYRVWYDGGIEAGTEWPEYIADHLSRCKVALLFISDNALASRNCIREINFAISEGRDMLAIYLHDVKLSPGMKMQLGTIQAMFRNRFIDDDSFASAILDAKIIASCKEGAEIGGESGTAFADAEEDLSAFFGTKKSTRDTSGFADSIPIKIYKGSVSDSLQANITRNAAIINRTFGEISITALVTSVEIGPMITTYRVHVNGTMRVSAINKAAENLKFALGVTELRLLPPTNRDLTVSIEIPNDQQEIVLLEDIIKESRVRESMGFVAHGDTSVCLGRTAVGEPMYADIHTLPHLLITGASQSGKTTLLHSMIVSMITRVPRERLGLILVDLKGVEFDIYGDEPHMQLPVIHDSKTAASILTELCEEMDRRFRLFTGKSARNIEQYNSLVSGEEILPRLLFIVDDYYDLVINHRKEIDNAIMRLSQKSRAAGIHVILSSQRADSTTLTGVIRANIPARIAFKMSSPAESREIIGSAEALELGTQADALFITMANTTATRISTPYIPIERIGGIVKYLINTEGKARYNQRMASGATGYAIPEIKESKKNYDKYNLPPLSLLTAPDAVDPAEIQKEIEETRAVITSTVKAQYNVSAEVVGAVLGPRFTRYELLSSRRLGVAKVKELPLLLEMNLFGRSVSIEQGIDNNLFIFVENKSPTPVYIRELLESDEFKNSESKTTVCLGKRLDGEPIISDVVRFPHALVCGATGMGKSNCLQAMITSILYKAKPDEVKLILIDPKRVEFSHYNGLAHLVTPVVNGINESLGVLYWAIEEMESRYESFLKLSVRDINEYNLRASNGAGAYDRLPRIVIIIDEIADLMVAHKAQFEELFIRIAQKGRHAGLHLILGTQRPDASVISGPLKANLPTRICLKVSTNADSRIALDRSGAEKLLNRGDMIVQFPDQITSMRAQAAFITDSEAASVVIHIEKEVTNVDKMAQDHLTVAAGELAVENGRISTAMLQRKFLIGYARAARLIDLLIDLGVIGRVDGEQMHKLLLTREEWERLKGIIGNE